MGRGEAPAIERLSPPEGLRSLLNYWYGRRFGAAWLRATDQRTYFEQTANLANRVQISRLLRPRDLSLLETQVGLLEKDLSNAR